MQPDNLSNYSIMVTSGAIYVAYTSSLLACEFLLSRYIGTSSLGTPF